MKRTKTELRHRAAMAKSRLATGFWTRERDNAVVDINNPNCADEQLFRRVADIVNTGENPLEHVLDTEYMQTLDDASRQRYVLMMSKRVNLCLARYNKVC